MLNAPYSSGGNNRIVYPGPFSGAIFQPHGGSPYQNQRVDYLAGVLDPSPPPFLPVLRQNAFFPSHPVRSDSGFSSEEASSLFSKPDKFSSPRVTYPSSYLLKMTPDQKKDSFQPLEPLSKDNKVNTPKVESKVQPGKPLKEKAKLEDARKGKADPESALPQKQSKPVKESWFNASTWIGAFKVTSALIVTGGINAFFFGVPIYVASGLSALLAGSQSLAALKVHKEDNEFTRKIVAFSRKVMGRQNDLTPAGKEWSMVPVWATICGFFGLSEAMANHTFKLLTGYQEKDFESRRRDLASAPLNNNGRFNLFQSIQKMQLSGMSLVQESKTYVETLFQNWAAKGGVRKIPHQVLKHVLNASGGRNMPLAYLWSFGVASFGGAFQTVLAALMQQKVDKAHGIAK